MGIPVKDSWFTGSAGAKEHNQDDCRDNFRTKNTTAGCVVLKGIKERDCSQDDCQGQLQDEECYSRMCSEIREQWKGTCLRMSGSHRMS